MSRMNEIAVIALPMTLQHVLDVFAARRDPRNTQDMSDAQFAEMVEMYQRNGSAWAAVAGDLTIAIGGVYVLRAHVGEAWFVPTSRVNSFPVAFCKIARMVLDDACRRFALHRIQLAVRADDAQALKFAERVLGGTREGLMRKYGSDGADYVRLANV